MFEHASELLGLSESLEPFATLSEEVHKSQMELTLFSLMKERYRRNQVLCFEVLNSELSLKTSASSDCSLDHDFNFLYSPSPYSLFKEPLGVEQHVSRRPSTLYLCFSQPLSLHAASSQEWSTGQL